MAGELYHVWYSAAHEAHMRSLSGKLPYLPRYIPAYYRLEDRRHGLVTCAAGFGDDATGDQGTHTWKEVHGEDYAQRWPDAVNLGYGTYCCDGLDA